MEKLEKKIACILIENDSADRPDGISELASEVKDIAIVFALHYAAEDVNINAEESFNKFISKYYK